MPSWSGPNLLYTDHVVDTVWFGIRGGIKFCPFQSVADQGDVFLSTKPASIGGNAIAQRHLVLSCCTSTSRTCSTECVTCRATQWLHNDVRCYMQVEACYTRERSSVSATESSYIAWCAGLPASHESKSINVYSYEMRAVWKYLTNILHRNRQSPSRSTQLQKNTPVQLQLAHAHHTCCHKIHEACHIMQKLTANSVPEPVLYRYIT